MCYTLSQTHLWEDMCSYIEHTGLSNQSSCIWTPALSAVCAFKVFPLCIWTSQSINGSASVSQESCIFGFASAGQAPTKTWTFHGCSPKSSLQSQQKAWSAHFTALAKVGPPLLKITLTLQLEQSSFTLFHSLRTAHTKDSEVGKCQGGAGAHMQGEYHKLALLCFAFSCFRDFGF